MSWVVIPAAGQSRRFGGELPKQYAPLFGRTVLHHTMDRLSRHPDVTGLMVVLADQDPHWPGWREMNGRKVLTAIGGAHRAESVLSGLRALPQDVRERDWVLVHDAARPCLRRGDLTRLIDHGKAHSVGAVLAAPVRDTIKRSTVRGEIEATESRQSLWRALTPQLFKRGTLTRALEACITANTLVTDESMAVERFGLRPLLVEGADDNLKITTPVDLAVAEFVLSRLSPEE